MKSLKMIKINYYIIMRITLVILTLQEYGIDKMIVSEISNLYRNGLLVSNIRIVFLSLNR
jgi:hypothetical protein